MKRKLLTLFVLASISCFAQQYDGVHFEKSNIDKNNLIYKLGKEFIYTFKIVENDTIVYLKNNDTNIFELTKNSDSFPLSEIYMTVLKPKIFKRVNKNQTQILYSLEPHSNSISTTGISENEQNVWLHPTRMGFFQSLETCPYSYIKLGKAIGYKWRDSMSIGSHWSNKKWGEWENRLLLNYEYEIIARENVVTKLGKIDCVKVRATATSAIGSSELIIYFSEKYGFVKLEYTLFTGIKIEMNLDQIIDGPILRDAKEFYQYKSKQ
ncbi:DUF3108 domain-containing protein [Flavobacterium frigidarium]|uniref:hypothetical protein n=1 Tax=Flavobacterium frigidarium TaxID=99286 RepID=UPI0003F7A0AD|nr:hypothetical protein [Flavobacterium frigidarium]